MCLCNWSVFLENSNTIIILIISKIMSFLCSKIPSGSHLKVKASLLSNLQGTCITWALLVYLSYAISYCSVLTHYVHTVLLCFLNTPNKYLPKGFRTGYFLCLEHSSTGVCKTNPFRCLHKCQILNSSYSKKIYLL